MHEYFAVRWDIVWVAAAEEVPFLRQQIEYFFARRIPGLSRHADRADHPTFAVRRRIAAGIGERRNRALCTSEVEAWIKKILHRLISQIIPSASFFPTFDGYPPHRKDDKMRYHFREKGFHSMNFFSDSTILSTLITIVSIVCSCGIAAIVLGGTGFFLFRLFKGMSQKKQLLQTGVSAPAVIVDVQDTGVTMNDSPQARMTLQVTPADRPPFQAVLTTFVGRFQVGLLVPGTSVQVRYDPNDLSKVAIESLGGATGTAPSANVQQLQTAMLAQDQYYAQLRETGTEARAKILTATNMNIRNDNTAWVFRLTFDVTTAIGEHFQAETQAAVLDASQYKYQPGKEVYVRYDPANRAQVALVRAVES